MSTLHDDLRDKCADMGRLIRDLPKVSIHMAGTHLKHARKAAEMGDSETVSRKLGDVADLLAESHGQDSKHARDGAMIASSI